MVSLPQTMSAIRRQPVAFLVVLAALLAPGAAAAAPHGEAAAVPLTRHERLLLQELNRARTARGLAPLRVDARLQSAARAHSTDMVRRGYFSHGDFAARMDRYGARGPRLAENIGWASGRERARIIVGMWLRSPGHRANMLRPGFTRVGVAGVIGRMVGRRALVATADFAGR
jgi:uncharacterized protein YkwD